MCDSCQVLVIQGVMCHEIGCPDSWKDKVIECKNCDTKFIPEERGQEFCSDSCYCQYWNLPYDEDYIEEEIEEDDNSDTEEEE